MNDLRESLIASVEALIVEYERDRHLWNAAALAEHTTPAHLLALFIVNAVTKPITEGGVK